MGLEYYAFALFVAGLICVIAIICKMLFSNVKRQQKLLDEKETQILQLYTSVETLMEEFNDQIKLTTEELKDYEYRAKTQASVFELPPELEKKEQLLEKLPRSLPFDANRIRAAGEVLERAERMAKGDTAATNAAATNAATTNTATVNTATVNTATANTATINTAVAQEPTPPEKEDKGAVFQKFFDDSAEAPPPPATTTAPQNMHTRSEAILALANEGKTDVEIASKLGITRNEVQLVIGLRT